MSKTILRSPHSRLMLGQTIVFLDVVCCYSNKGAVRGKRHFKFHDKGKFEQLAQRMRTKVVNFMSVVV